MKKKKSIIIVAVCVLAAAGIAAGIYGMTHKKGSPEAVNDSTAQTVQEQTTQEVKNPHAGQAAECDQRKVGKQRTGTAEGCGSDVQ